MSVSQMQSLVEVRTFEEECGWREHCEDNDSVHNVRKANTIIGERQACSEAEQQPTRSDARRAYPHSQSASFEEPLANER
jgi:hypothetical protein